MWKKNIERDFRENKYGVEIATSLAHKRTRGKASRDDRRGGCGAMKGAIVKQLLGGSESIPLGEGSVGY